jgi:hypothetical protein
VELAREARKAERRIRRASRESEGVGASESDLERGWVGGQRRRKRRTSSRARAGSDSSAGSAAGADNASGSRERTRKLVLRNA